MAISVTLPNEMETIDKYEVKSSIVLNYNGGIYFLFNDKNDLLYVGQTKELKRRLQAHIRGGTNTHHFHKQIAYIKYFIVNNPLDRDIYEVYAIKTLKPLYNVSKNDREVNVMETEDELESIEFQLRMLNEERAEILGRCDYDSEDTESEYDVDAFDYDDTFAEDVDDDSRFLSLGQSLYDARRLEEVETEIYELTKAKAALKRRLSN